MKIDKDEIGEYFNKYLLSKPKINISVHSNTFREYANALHYFTLGAEWANNRMQVTANPAAFRDKPVH